MSPSPMRAEYQRWPRPRMAERIAERGDESGEGDDEAGALLLDAVIDDAAVDQRRGGTGDGVDDDQAEEDGDRAAVGRGEADDAADGAGGEAVIGDGAVLREAAERRVHVAHFCEVSS